MKARPLPLLFLFLATTLVLVSCGGPTPTPSPIPSPTAIPQAGAASSIIRSSRYNPSIRFERIGIEEGLSQNSVDVILQDSQGFL